MVVWCGLLSIYRGFTDIKITSKIFLGIKCDDIRHVLVWPVCKMEGQESIKHAGIGIVMMNDPMQEVDSYLSKASVRRFTICFHAILVEEASVRVHEFNSLFRIC